MSDLCPVCRGAGNIVTTARGIEVWPCVCGGSGVTVQYGPSHFRRKKGTRK